MQHSFFATRCLIGTNYVRISQAIPQNRKAKTKKNNMKKIYAFKYKDTTVSNRHRANTPQGRTLKTSDTHALRKVKEILKVELQEMQQRL